MDEGGATVPAVEVDDATVAQRFFDLSIDLLAVLDLETTILQASHSFQRTLGWPPEAVVGRSLLEFFHPDDMARIDDELATVLGGGDAVAVVVRVLGADGSYRWVQGNARSDLDEGRIYVTAADITDRMKLEDALRAHVNLEELVVSIASRLIGAEDQQITAEIERGMAELAQAMGADRGHFLRGRSRQDNTTYIEWRNPDTVDREHTPAPDPDVQRWWRDALRNDRLLRLDDVDELAEEAPHVVQALREDGVRSLLHVPLSPHRGHWGFLTMVAVRDQATFSDDSSALLRLAGECFMSALAEGEDAVALRDAGEELERRNEELERANEELGRANEELERANEELEGFAYAAAHDLKAPLARVEMALSATPSVDASTDQVLDVARRATSRMRQLIEDLLTFAAVGSPAESSQPVDLDALLTDVLSDFEATITARGIRVERSPLTIVDGHRSLLGQLFQNLIGNALKFTRPDVPPLVRVDMTPDPQGVTIVVSDNGIGIEPRYRTEVFGVFTRLNSEDAYGGSGIGLATCAKVVQHHRGRISIEDGIDGGTAVKVWLPFGQSFGHGRD